MRLHARIDRNAPGYMHFLPPSPPSRHNPSPCRDAPDVTAEDFARRFEKLASSGIYHIVVVEHVATSRVVATATMLVEHKFIRNCATAGHIEDVVVDSDYRGFGLGRQVVEHLLQKGSDIGCYKVILDCGDRNVSFYEKCGMVRKGVQMGKYY